MSSEPVIGIDLGTTFSCVSVYRRDRPELIINQKGQRLTPSIVFFKPQNGKVSVGQVADGLLPTFPKNGLLDAKRFIGRKYDDEFISSFIKSNKTHFTLVRAADDQVAFEIEVDGQKIIKKPEEVSAEVLKYLKSTANTYLGVDVKKAVIPVPAYFSNAQRSATKTAAELAGLTVLNLITEPTAAAIHYVSDKNRDNSNVLVFDFGGGTLDLSLINVKNNIFEVKAVYGDTLLGGRVLDEILFEHFYTKFQDTHNSSSFVDRVFKRRLNKLCRDLKEELSTEEEQTIFMDMFDGNFDLNISLKRTQFETMINEIIENVNDIIQLCMSDSGLSASEIDEVILVGGSTRIPKIQELLKSHFGSQKIRMDLNPDEAVAAGASIYAAFLAGNNQNLEKYEVKEITPMSLGIRTDINLMNVFLRKHRSLPAKATKELITRINNQSEMYLAIFEGERKNTKYNNKLADFKIEGLPKKCAGDVIVSVDFNLDANGILNVTATETSTGKTNKLAVTMGQFRFSDNRLKCSLEDALRHKTEDEIFEKFELRRSSLHLNCRRVLYNLEKISTSSDRDSVQRYCENFLKVSTDLDFNEIEKLNDMYNTLRSIVSPILNKYSMVQLP